ncbi:hypothetical protein KPH14_004684 [Odynerus spinipes]|uniref:Uncharacterized protein n=1 Tax=Odynerus spinipes TaxID=1348599 RepID=A0AAD9VPW7_9HYME|nr:hypothetical protein KPH14_004684 [Odynerus spinipes]
MALHRRRGDDFTNYLNNCESHKSLDTMAEEKCDLNKCINLFEDRNTTKKSMLQNNIEDYSIKSQNKVNEQLLNKFDSVLFSLDNELNPVEASSTKKEIYRRLSDKYISSPRKFTEKLITIIEESVINSTLNMSNNSIINFEKISKELQRMCNDIENESMPEQLLSTTVTALSNKEISKIMMNNNPIQSTIEKHCSEVSSSLSLNRDSCTIRTPSPINTRKKVYRKTPRSIFKSEMKKMDDIIILSPSKNSDSSFEYLEAQCKRLFPNEKKDRTSVQTISDSTLLSMDHVFTICEQQLASLNSTDDDIKIISQKKDSVKELQKRSRDVSCSLYPNTENTICIDESRKKKFQKINDKAFKVNLNSEHIRCTDELDKTFLSEIAEKRRRCLDTAKKMMEINSECDTMKIQKESNADCKSTLDVNSNKPQDDHAMFLKMLMSCKDYHNYLENQLPILNVSYSSKNLETDPDINKSNKKNVNINLIPKKRKLSTNRENIYKSNSKSRHSKSYTENYKKILARWNVSSENNERKVEKAVDKSKLFITPGKISAKDKQIQRVYFSDLHTIRKQRSALKSSINQSKQFGNNMLSPACSYNKDSLKTTLQVGNRQLSSKSIKSPSRKVSKVNVTSTPKSSARSLIRQNLLALRKCSADKNKENKIN